MSKPHVAPSVPEGSYIALLTPINRSWARLVVTNPAREWNSLEEDAEWMRQRGLI